MKRNKKKGFTLVELLAVIVILAIILVIAVPQIMSTIKDTTKASLESSAKMIAAQVEKQYTVAQTLGKEFGETGSCMQDWAGLNDVDYESCTYEIVDGKAIITLEGKGKFKNLNVCEGTRSGASVQEEPCGGTETDEACFQYEVVYDVKVGNKTSCMTYTRPIIVNLFGYTEEDLDTFCSGNVMDTMTFSQHINQMIYEEETTIEELKSNGVVTDVKEVIEVTGYDGTCGTSVNVPRKIDNKLVYGIGYEAFVGTGITTVNLPTSLRYIGEGAFTSNGVSDSYGNVIDPYGTVIDPYGATTPTDPYGGTIPTQVSVNITGELDLSNLTNLVLISHDAFYENNITSVKFSNNLVAIGTDAFYNNQISGVLDLSNTKLETIGRTAFKENEITSVKFSNNLVAIGIDAFYNNQISGVLDLSNTKLETIGQTAFKENNITSVKLPSTITTIGLLAFSKTSTSNPNLTKIINPSKNKFPWGSIVYAYSESEEPMEFGYVNGVRIATS